MYTALMVHRTTSIFDLLRSLLLCYTFRFPSSQPHRFELRRSAKYEFRHSFDPTKQKNARQCLAIFISLSSDSVVTQLDFIIL
jgi:hypothetical protein